MSLSGEELGMTAKQNPHMNYEPFNTRKKKKKKGERSKMHSMTVDLISALKAILSEQIMYKS